MNLSLSPPRLSSWEGRHGTNNLNSWVVFVVRGVGLKDYVIRLHLGLLDVNVVPGPTTTTTTGPWSETLTVEVTKS